MHSCLLACKKLFDEYLQRSIYACYGTSLVDLAPLGRGFTSLLKLCLIEEPGWDLSIVRQTANLVFYFESLLSIFHQVGSDLDGRQLEQSRHSCFTGCARAITVIKTWYEMKVASEETQTSMLDQAGMAGYDTSMMGGQNFLDDTYWLDFMGDWSLQQ
jgi:hypothetical protein